MLVGRIFLVFCKDLIISCQVGGVRYNAFDEATLKYLIANHRSVEVRGVRRRAILQQWNYGSMTGSGHRQPPGGLKGDGYAPYVAHMGNTVEDIRALFRHAAVCSFLGSAFLQSF